MTDPIHPVHPGHEPHAPKPVEKNTAVEKPHAVEGAPPVEKSGFDRNAADARHERALHTVGDDLPAGPAIQSHDLYATQVKETPREDAGIARAVEAARAGNLTVLKVWLAAGGDPNHYDAAGWTPLLAAAVRGHARAVELLLHNDHKRADPEMAHRDSHALAIHFAGHAGSVAAAKVLLDERPKQLDAVWPLNGHTLLLQAAFYGSDEQHRELARFALERGANTAATTVRGLAPLEMALQFNNQKMADIIRPRDATKEAKAAYFAKLLHDIAPPPPPDAEREAQAVTNLAIAAIEQGLQQATSAAAVDAALAELKQVVAQTGFEVNRLGGALQQPPLVVAVTGNDGVPPSEHKARFRRDAVTLLLSAGADPMVQEVHPMGVDAFIRALVFNHLDALKAMGASGKMTKARLAEALNRAPLANGLTGYHDTVLRAGSASAEQLPGYLAQIRWLVQSGARNDLADFSGRTQESIARAVTDTARQKQLLQAMGIV